jgi:hypothetical protein
MGDFLLTAEMVGERVALSPGAIRNALCAARAGKPHHPIADLAWTRPGRRPLLRASDLDAWIAGLDAQVDARRELQQIAQRLEGSEYVAEAARLRLLAGGGR